MIEIQLNIQELAFLMESAKAMTIKGVDAPFVTGIMNKIQTGAQLLEQQEKEKTASKSATKK